MAALMLMFVLTIWRCQFVDTARTDVEEDLAQQEIAEHNADEIAISSLSEQQARNRSVPGASRSESWQSS
jgi:hypothetical protein